MTYVSGFVTPVPDANREAYRVSQGGLGAVRSTARSTDGGLGRQRSGGRADRFSAVRRPLRDAANVVLRWILWPDRNGRPVRGRDADRSALPRSDNAIRRGADDLRRFRRGLRSVARGGVEPEILILDGVAAALGAATRRPSLFDVRPDRRCRVSTAAPDPAGCSAEALGSRDPWRASARRRNPRSPADAFRARGAPPRCGRSRRAARRQAVLPLVRGDVNQRRYGTVPGRGQAQAFGPGEAGQPEIAPHERLPRDEDEGGESCRHRGHRGSRA